MRIDAVIRKYNLQWDDQFVSQLGKVSKNEKRFKWANLRKGMIPSMQTPVSAQGDLHSPAGHLIQQSFFTAYVLPVRS